MASNMPASRPPYTSGGMLPSGRNADVSFAVPVSPQLEDSAPMASIVVGPDTPGAHVDAAPGSASLGGAGAAEARALGAGLVAVDLASVLVSFAVMGFELSDRTTFAARVSPGLLGAAAALAAVHLLGLHRSRNCARVSSHLGRLTLAAIVGGLVLLAAQLPLGNPRWLSAACTGTAVATLSVGRWRYGRFLRARRADGRYLRRVLLVGSNADAASLRTTLRSEPELGYAVAGVVACGPIDPSLEDLPRACTLSAIPDLAATTRAGGVFVVPYALSSTAVREAVSVAMHAGLHVQVWPGLHGIGDARLRRMPLSGEALFYVEPQSSARWQLVAKRAIDVVGAALALACTAPLLALAALLVKLDSRGPVFYRGERVGLHGDPIFPLKLRTMVAEDPLPRASLELLNQRTDGPLFKSSVDPRVTRVGHFLRASSIDELPQLWNVLKGTMSLIGPRPALPAEAAQFDPELQRRHSVRPGMTGLWQVEARHNPSFNAYRRLDLHYVDNWSLWLDVSILAATVPAVLSQTYRAIKDHRHHG